MAAGNTYVALASNTLTTTAASVTFSAISGSYTDLILAINTTVSSGTPNITLQFNGDTGSNYSCTTLSGNGGGGGGESNRLSTQTYIRTSFNGNPSTGTAYQNSLIHINNYIGSTAHKSVLIRNNNAYTAGVDLIVGAWRDNTTISSLVIATTSSTFASGSTFTLYGIAAA